MMTKNFFDNKEHIQYINWKSLALLKRYMTRFGDIKPRKYTGNSVKVQKMLRISILRARELGLLPYIK